MFPHRREGGGRAKLSSSSGWRQQLVLWFKLVVICLAGGFGWPLLAQDGRGVVRAVPQADLERLGFDAAESTALFAGVRDFEDKTLASVPYAVDDAVDLAYLFAVELALLTPPRTVLALSGEPVKPASRERLAALKAAGAQVKTADRSALLMSLHNQSLAAGEKGLFLVGFATHGFTVAGEDYLFAQDTTLLFPDRTAVPRQWLFEALTNASTPRRFALLDACREQLEKGTRGLGTPMGEGLHDAIASARGQVVLAATTTGGYAYDDPDRQNGVFTAAIVDGLRGAAPKNPEHFITAGSLADYVDQQVLDWVGRHRPSDHRTQGITRTIEGAGASLPLAADPDALKRMREYAQHRTAAMDKLKANLGSPLPGWVFDCVQTFLDGEDPTDAQLELLSEIESLDGTSISKRRLKAYIEIYVSPHCGPHDSIRDSIEISLKRCEWFVASDLLTSPPGSNAFECYESVLEQVPGNADALMGIDRIAETYVKRIEESLRADDRGKAKTDLSGLRRVSPKHPRLEELEQKLEPPPGTLWTEPVTGMEFVWIPRGCFQMGSEDGESDERPLHRVCVSGFWMGRQEVTQGQWQAVMYDNPSGFRRGLNHPVERVSWNDVQGFLKKLNARGREGFRLPSEAQWEYACRGGQAGLYCGGDDPDPLAWFSRNSENTPHPVGGKQANAWGLQDLSGNVWEWVQDCYYHSYQDAPADGSAREEANCPWRVFRGGAWANYLPALRAASRLRQKPTFSSDDLGFRLSRRP